MGGKESEGKGNYFKASCIAHSTESATAFACKAPCIRGDWIIPGSQSQGWRWRSCRFDTIQLSFFFSFSRVECAGTRFYTVRLLVTLRLYSCST